MHADLGVGRVGTNAGAIGSTAGARLLKQLDRKTQGRSWPSAGSFPCRTWRGGSIRRCSEFSGNAKLRVAALLLAQAAAAGFGTKAILEKLATRTGPPSIRTPKPIEN